MSDLQLNGFSLQLSITAALDGHWMALPLIKGDRGFEWNHKGIRGELVLRRDSAQITHYSLCFTSAFPTRLRVKLSLRDQSDLFHLIPANIFGDNNAAHVRAGEFPCLTNDRPSERNRAPLWEFRADRASHPVSILCCSAGAVGISIDPYSGDQLRNGVFAALPDTCGVSLGYGNDPLTFVEKTNFIPATCDQAQSASASGTIYAFRGAGRAEAHHIIRDLHRMMRNVPKYEKSCDQALRALADAFIEVNFSTQLGQYTNRRCLVPVDRELKPWRAIVEIGWTGGSMLAYPFALTQKIFPDITFPKSPKQIFDEIFSGFNESSGLINDTALNRFTRDIPAGWNQSTINGWWSGFLPQTRDAHCAYTNAHAAYYALKLGVASPIPLRVLDTAMQLQRDDGAFGYLFSSSEKKVIDWDGFAGCWFAAAMALAWRATGQSKYRDSGDRALNYYWSFVRDLTCWGTPMDTYKSIDSEGNLAFIRAARLMHQFTREDRYLAMLRDGAEYEYLWRYCFRTNPLCPPLKGSNWNSCGGSITSVSNPHIHPMSVVATSDLEYLSRETGDSYHQQRADDGMAWLMNTMELYPDVVGYGRYGVLSERTCPSDGLLVERYHDDNSPASTWWSYNAWAAGSAMEAIAEHILARE